MSQKVASDVFWTKTMEAWHIKTPEIKLRQHSENTHGIGPSYYIRKVEAVLKINRTGKEKQIKCESTQKDGKYNRMNQCKRKHIFVIYIYIMCLIYDISYSLKRVTRLADLQREESLPLSKTSPAGSDSGAEKVLSVWMSVNIPSMWFDMVLFSQALGLRWGCGGVGWDCGGAALWWGEVRLDFR